LIDSDSEVTSGGSELYDDIFDDIEEKPVRNTDPERFKFTNMFDLTLNSVKRF